MEINNINLRHDGDVLVPCGNPRLLDEFKGWTPVATVSSLLLAYKDEVVALGSPQNAVSLGAAIRCAVRNEDCTFTFMTTAGACEVRAESGMLSVKRLAEDYPAVEMRAVAANPQTATVRRRELSSNISAGALRSPDEKAMTADLVSAYRRLCSLAAATGSAIQPAIARYRLADDAGRTVFTSQPVLLMPEGGAQLCDYIPVYSDDGQSVNEYSVTARTWKLGLSLPHDAAACIARLDVMMTPLFHPFDESMPSPVTYGRYATSADVFARIALPGRQRGLGGAFAQNSAATIRKAIARLGRLETCIASIHDPFGEACELTVDIAANPQPEADVKALASVLGKPAYVMKRSLAAVTAPHGFSATTGAAGAAAVMWSGLRTIPFKGYMPQVLAAGVRSQRPWTATVAVLFRNGKGVVRSASGSSGAFTALAPVLCYPSAEAVRMAVQIVSDNVVRHGGFELTPDESGRFSVYVSPGLEEIALKPVTSAQTFDFGDASETLPSMIAFAPAENPAEIRHITYGGNPTAMLARDKPEQSWEFGRSHFVAGMEDGIYSVAVDSDFENASLRRIFSGGVAGQNGLCGDGEGGFFAISGGRLLHVGSGGHVKMFENSERYLAVGLCRARHELWALCGDGEVLAFEGCGKDRVALRKGLGLTGIIDCGAEAFGLSERGIALIDNEFVPERQNVGIRRLIVPARYVLRTIGGLRIDMQAADFDGEILIEGVNAGEARPWLIKRCAVRGSVAGSIELPLISRPMRALRLTLVGAADSTLRLRPDPAYH